MDAGLIKGGGGIPDVQVAPEADDPPNYLQWAKQAASVDEEELARGAGAPFSEPPGPPPGVVEDASDVTADDMAKYGGGQGAATTQQVRTGPPYAYSVFLQVCTISD